MESIISGATSIFSDVNILGLIAGLALFLFGMQLMGNALEKKAGGSLKNILEKMTDNPFKGFILGMIVTCVIQSSSATTVMVVGFVNSGIMKLRQAISIIMGANIGTTITAWIFILAGIDGENKPWYVSIFSSSTFVPILAAIGVILFVFLKDHKKNDLGMILLGFATLMTGMDIMGDAVALLEHNDAFKQLFTLFTNPIFGVLAGAILTAIIQSSSASVGILQTLSGSGAITFASAIPIIMGQNIGTCVTAMISCMGANKNAKRTAFVHLYFNVIGTLVLLIPFSIMLYGFNPDWLGLNVDRFWISVVHTAFNVTCTALWFPFTRLLEKLACLTVRDTEEKEHYEMLDERLLATPAIAVERCNQVATKMATISVDSIRNAFYLLTDYKQDICDAVAKAENKADKYEDRLGSYLVRLSSCELSDSDNVQCSKLLHIISDFERISDHAVNIMQSADEISSKKLEFSGEAKAELSVMINAVSEIVDLAYDSYANGNLDSAIQVEPLEQVVDNIKDTIKSKHISRLQKGECTIELGFVLTDLVTNLERVSDHCSNIAGCMLETAHNDMSIHKYLRSVKGGDKQEYNHYYDYFRMKYDIEKA